MIYVSFRLYPIMFENIIRFFKTLKQKIMNNNTTNKKKFELKKTAIGNLTQSESQMRMVVGGDGDKNLVDTDFSCPEANCTSMQPPIPGIGKQNTKTL